MTKAIRLALLLSLPLLLLFAHDPNRSPAADRGLGASSPGRAPTSAADAAVVRLPGHELSALRRATPIASAGTATDPITLTFVLEHDDQTGFDRYLRGLSDPTAPNYRRFLTQREIADRFGPSADAYDRVLRYAQASGFEVVDTSANRLTLTVRGTRADAEHALRVRIGDYQLGDRTFFANDEDPALPDEIASHVRSVAGLSNLARPAPTTDSIMLAYDVALCALLATPVPCGPGHKTCVKSKDGNAVKNPYKECISAAKKAAENHTTFVFNFFAFAKLLDSSSCPLLFEPCPPGYVEFDASALTLPRARAAHPRAATPVDGTAQKIAIVGFDTFQTSDVADYLALLGFPPSQLANLSQVHVNGGATPGKAQDELLLDVTTVMTLAPAAQVVVYDAPFAGPGSTFQDLFNAALNDNPTIISNSFAYCEDQTSLADVQGIDAIFQSAAMSNVSVFNAAGDSGSTCLDGSPNTAHVPASAPHATAVGGSSVTSGDGKARKSETWWNGANATPPTGQGGFGVSRFFPRPSYQNGFTTSPMRSIPDVVASADPADGVMICQASAGGCPTGALYGGTSLTAPLWAAYTALINQAVGSNLGFLNPLLYPLAATPGFNGPAALSSDFAHVGLGSPNVDQLIAQLRGDAIGTPDPDLSLVSPALQRDVISDFDVPMTVPADGVSQGFVVVALLDANQHGVAGKTVTLTASGGTHVTITPASGVTDAAGEVVFTVKDLTAEDVIFTATDTTDGFPLTTNPRFPFVVPTAASGSVVANRSNVTADGMDSATITVTLVDALQRPTPGKEVRLEQGAGHSVIAGPDPSVTDVNGQIAFTVTDLVNETVTYSAADVSDGDLAIPGMPQVTFGNGAGTACGNNDTPPVAADGFVVTPFATGFAAGSLGVVGGVSLDFCAGASSPAFREGRVFITNFMNGDIFDLDAAGGAASTADRLATLAPTLESPVVGKDGRLYAAQFVTTGNFDTGAIFEIDPDTGAVLRTVASNLRCIFNLTVDPLSGDLFYDDFCLGGAADPTIHRVRDPASATPTVEVYATLPGSPNGHLTFAPNGTLYAVASYFDAHPPVVRISGTDQPMPPTVTTLPGLESQFWVNVAEVDADGEAQSLLVLTADGLEVVDIADPQTRTPVAQNLGGGEIGPDGCLYASASSVVYKVTNANGGCSFAAAVAPLALTLTPTTVSPDPSQGTSETFTATFRNTDVPEDTPVLFAVKGANPQVRMTRTNADGEAMFTLAGVVAGDDVVTAQATIADSVLTSNKARVTWVPGKHRTFLTLNPSPKGGSPGLPVPVVASLTDNSVNPPVPVAGATVELALGGPPCSTTTDVKGRATCVLTVGDPGTEVLTASFAGTAQLLPSQDARAFAAVGGEPLATFMVYKTAKATPKFVKLGPVTLADDDFGSVADYDVVKPTTLALPASRNGDMVADPDTHLESYAVKLAKGSPRFVKRPDVHVVNQCDDAVVTVTKPAELMLPTAKDLSNPVSPPQESDHNVDHFLCYKVKTQKKRADGTPTTPLAKRTQVDVADQLHVQARRYDLKKLALLCNPVAKSGNPTLLSGHEKGTPFAITPSTIRNPGSRLLCYTAKLAKKTIAQNGCGPADPADKGTKITQQKTVPQLGVHVANQFGSGQLDAKKETLVCIPSVAAP